MNTNRTTSTPIAVALLMGIALSLCSARALAQKPISIVTPNQTDAISFQKDVLPILQKKCLACHSVGEAYGDLVLESPASLLKGGDSGPSVVPRRSDESLLLKVASHREEPLMPPPDNDVAAAPMTPAELGIIKLWIDQGATGDAGDGTASPRDWRPLPPGMNPIYAVAVTADGQYAACSRANQIFIYHVPTGQFITRLNDPSLQARGPDQRPGVAHLDMVQSLAFNSEGDVLASGGFRTAKLWRRPRDVRLLNVAASDEAVSAVAVSPRGDLMATGSADHGIKLWAVPSGEPQATLDGHEGPITSLRFSADGSRLYSASDDQTVRAWDTSEGELVGRIDTPSAVNAVEIYGLPVPAAPPSDADEAAEAATESEAETTAPFIISDRLVTGGADNLVRVWQVPEFLPEVLPEMPEAPAVVAVSPDRHLMAIATTEGEVRVQHVSDGKLIQTWKAHESAIHSIAFQPTPPVESEEESDESAADTDDSDEAAELLRVQLLATAGADNTVRIWDAMSGELVTVLRGSLAPVLSLAFHPDGQQLFAGSEDGGVTIWKLDADDPRVLEAGETGPARVSAISRDRKRLATSGTIDDRPAILVRDVETGEVTHRLLGHESAVRSLAFNADATQLVSGSDDSSVRVWDLSDAKFPELARLAGHSEAVTGVAFGEAGQVVSGGADGTVRLWNIGDEQELLSFEGHNEPVTAVGMASGNRPVSASADKTVRIWNAADGKQQRAITLSDAALAMTVSDDGARLAVAVADHEIHVFQTTDGAAVASMSAHTDSIHSLAFTADGNRLVSGAADNLAIAWNAADGRLLEAMPIENGLASVAYGEAPDTVLVGTEEGGIHVRSLRFSQALLGMAQPVTAIVSNADGTLAIAACLDGTVRGFNITTAQQAYSANHGAPVHSLAIGPDGQRLASGGEDKLVKFWNPANGAPSQPTALPGSTGPVSAVTFAAEGGRLLAADAETNVVLVFDVANGAIMERLVGHEAAVTSLAGIGVEQDQVLTVAADGTVRRWPLLSDRQIAGHSQPVTSLAITPAGDDPLAAPPRIVSGSEDGTLREWNFATGQQLRQLNHGGPVTSVGVRPDGQRFASASANNTAKLWNAANNQQLAEMRGDLRALSLVARLNQDKTAATANVQAATAAVAAAEQALPMKEAAAKTAADALAAANKDVEAKQGVLKTASDAKAAAEKVAIEAAAAAQKMALVKAAADEQVALATAAMNAATEQLAKDQSAAQADPDNTALAQAVAKSEAAVAAADTKLKAAVADMEAKAKTAAESAAQANDAAAKVADASKPFQDAATALQESESVQNQAAQAAALTEREAKEAADLVPAVKAELATHEQRVKEIDEQLAAAQEAAQAAEQPIHAIAFSPDNQQLATGGDLGIVHTWDAETGKAVASHVGHEAAIASLAYLSADSLATGSIDTTAALWDLNPGWVLERTIGSIDDPSTLINRVTALAFSPDGKLLATGGGEPSRSGELKVWNSLDGSLVQALPEAHTDAVFGVCFSPDATLIASGGADKYVRTFEVATGEEVRTFEGHTDHVLGVAWRADGRVLASSGADNTVRIWNADDGDRLRVIQNYTKQVSSVRFIGQSPNTISGSADATVRMHNSDNGQNVRNFAGSTDFVYGADATPDGQTVVAGGYDSVLRIWNGANSQVLHAIEPPAEADESTELTAAEVDARQAAN